MNNVLAFPGGPCVIDLFPAEDTDRTTLVPAPLAHALAELERARHAICSSVRVTHELSSELNIACAKVEYAVAQHCGRGEAR